MKNKKKSAIIDLFNNNLHTPSWLFWILVIVMILRIPSFFEPYSYGDELIYLTLGEGIRRGIPLYSGIHDNKPPLLYILAAIAGSLFWFKALLAFWHLITVFVFWKITDHFLPKNQKFQKVATVIFAILTTIPLLEGNIANAEMFMIGFTLLGFLILLSKKLDVRNLLFSGVLFSIATMFKVPAVFDTPAIVFLWLLKHRLDKNHILDVGKRTIILSIGFATPIILTFVWFYFQGALKEYVIAAYLQNFGYVSSWRPSANHEPFLIKNLPLLIRAFLTLSGISGLYVLRKKLSILFIFSSAWLILALFAATLSERPYPHYLIQIVAPLSLLFGILITDKTKKQTFTVFPLLLAFIVPVYFKFWYYPTSVYYVKFANFALGKLSTEEYFKTFNSRVPSNYKLASYVSTITAHDDPVFVWGEDSYAIYALSRRLPPIKYVANYHIFDFSSPKTIAEEISIKSPKLIIKLPDAPVFPELDLLLTEKYSPLAKIDGAQIWIRLTPQVSGVIAN